MKTLIPFKSSLLSSTAITRVVSVAVVAGALSLPLSVALPLRPAFAACTPLTAGADNTNCTGNLDGTNSDALAGNDTITIHSHVGDIGNATVSGGADNDSITFQNAPKYSVIVGNGAGSSGQVLGDTGNDTITLNDNNVGRNGAGTVSGGADDDSITLSNGSRIGLFGAATGQILGDAGDDTITLNNNSDVGFGSAGTVSGGDGADSIALNSGSDIGYHTTGTGLVAGDAGDDTITLNNANVGYSGDGTVSGGADNDSISLADSSLGFYASGTGQVLGDAGNDTITLVNSKVGRRGAGTVSGGSGNDSIALSNSSHLGNDAGSTGQVLGDAGNDTITLQDIIVGRLGAGTVSGGDGADSITTGGISLIGFLAGSTGQLLGDAGNDTITLTGTHVGVYGAGTVSGGADNDSITLSTNAIIGNMVGSTGQVLGDAGNDTITVSGSFVGYRGAGTVSGGDGADSIALRNLSHIGRDSGSTGQVLGDTGGDTITLDFSDVGYIGAGTVSGGADNDSIALSYSNIGRDSGSTGQVLGDAGDDTITLDRSYVGRYGAGTVSGGADNDSIALSNYSDIGRYSGSTGQVLGDAGSDTITLNYSKVGYRGAGTVSGGADNDSIALSNNSDIGRDSGSTGQVLGDAGDDTITLDSSYVGRQGAATVSGGDGADSIALSNSSVIGRDSVSTGQVLGGAGNDTISLNAVVKVGESGAGTVSGGAGDDFLSINSSIVIGENATGTGQVLGDAGNDTIRVTNSSIIGSSGNGTVSGGADNDSIFIGYSNTIGANAGSTGLVTGDAGNDTIHVHSSIIGASGAATVDGGAGNDSIALSNGTSVGASGQVLGGAGDDTISIDTSLVRAAGSVVDGGADTDLLSFTANANATINPGEFLNFEELKKDGASTLSLTGNQTFADKTTIAAGTLEINGTLTTALLDVQAGASFIPNSTVIGNVSNSGLISPGGDGNVDTLNITGNFTQTATGTLNVDIDPANGVSDKVDVTGTATLAGTLGVNPLGAIAPTNEYVIIDAAGGVIGTFDAVTQTIAITQSVAIEGTEVILKQVVDFTPETPATPATPGGASGPSGATPSQTAVGDNLNAVLAAGGAGGNLQAAMTSIAGITDGGTFQGALDQLHSQPHQAQELDTAVGSNSFATTMMSCPVSNGAMSIGVEGQCIWAKTAVRKFEQDRTAGNIGIDEKAASIAGGFQFALSEMWHLGFGARYESVNSDIDTRATSEGDRFNFGTALKGRWGDSTLATVVEGGFANFDTTRFIRLPGLALDAQGEQDVGHVTTHTRLAHSFKAQTMYIRPMVDLSATYINLGSITETGAGNLGLNVASTDEWIFAVTPAIEFGSEFNIAGGSAVVRPFIRAGVTFLSEDSISVSTSFLGAPAGVSPFTITSEFDDVFAVVEGGIDIIGGDGVNLKLNYDGQFAEDTRIHAGGAKLGFKF